MVQLPDYSEIDKSLSQLIYGVWQAKALQVSDIEWVAEESKADEDNLTFVEPFFKTMAELLYLIYQKESNWDKVVQFYKSNGLDRKFCFMQPMILEDNLFSDIKAALGGE